MKKIFGFVLISLLFLPGLLCAAPSLPAQRNFNLVHTLTSNATYHFVFQNMADTPVEITSADVSNGGKFARVVINFNDDVLYSFNLKFSPLEHVSLANTFCEYTMEVLRPNSNETLVPVVPNQSEGHSACSATLNGRVDYQLSGTWQNEYLAELKITLDTDSALAGIYAGTIIIEQITDGGGQ